MLGKRCKYQCLVAKHEFQATKICPASAVVGVRQINKVDQGRGRVPMMDALKKAPAQIGIRVVNQGMVLEHERSVGRTLTQRMGAQHGRGPRRDTPRPNI